MSIDHTDRTATTATLCDWCEESGCTDARHAQLYAESETRWRRIAERRAETVR